MRALTEEETEKVFEKLYKFIGANIKLLISRTDEPYCLRLHRSRVFYVSERIMRRAACIGRKSLVSLGTCLGKFTKSSKFKVGITALELMSTHAKHKVWVKPSAELSFLYGNHVLKSGLGRITDNCTNNQGVIVMSMSDVPLGFGVCMKSTQECRKLDPTAVVAVNQADVGEYLRQENEL